MWRAIQIGVFLASAFVSCESIYCYSCSNVNDPDCLTPEKLQKLECSEALRKTTEYAAYVDPSYTNIFNVDYAKRDSEMPFNCLKLVAKNANGVVVTLRGCQLAKNDKVDDVCKKVMDKDKNKTQVIHCSLCDEDECNVSIRNVVDIKLLLAIAIFKLIF